MDPQQGTGHLPFLKDAALAEPLRCSFVLRFARYFVICGRVRRRLPFSKALSQLPPCDRISYETVGEDGTDDEQFTSPRLSAVCCMIVFVSIAGRFKVSDDVEN